MLKGKLLLAFSLISTIWFSSCSMQKYCNERFPPEITTKDSTWTEYVCEYDTVYFPEEAILLDTALDFIPPTLVYHSWQKQGRLTAKIDIKNGRLNFQCAEDSLLAIVEIQNKIIRESHSRTSFKLIPCGKEHKTKWNYFCTYFTWIAIALILIAVIIKCLRG